MIQTLDIQTKIQIPEHLVIIEKAEFERLRELETKGRIGNSKWLETITNKSLPTLKKLFLEHPDRKKEVEPFTRFPRSKGQPWEFDVEAWLEYLNRPDIKRILLDKE